MDRARLLRKTLVPALLVLGGLLCCGGPAFRRLGLYSDDWTLLSNMQGVAPGLAGMRTLLSRAEAVLFRPLELPVLAAAGWAFGERPLGWHAALLCWNLLLSAGVYAVLRRFLVPASWSALGALAFLAYPSKDATMFWPICFVYPMSAAGVVLAYLAHLSYVESGRERWRAASAALLLLSLALFEQAVFLAPVWLVTPRRGGPDAARRRWKGFLAAACAAAFIVVYQLVLVPRFAGLPHNKTVVLSPGHFIHVYWAGAKALAGPRLWAYVLKAAWREAGTALPVALACLALPWAVWLRKDEAPPRAACSARLALLGAGIAALAYLPIALSDYDATPFNHQNRLNMLPVLGLVLACVGLASRLRRGSAAKAAAALLVGVLLAAHASFAEAWAESYRAQLAIRRAVLEGLAAWPPGDTLVLYLRDRYVRGKAPIFVAPWEIAGAVRLWTGDPSRKADVLSPSARLTPRGIENVDHVVPYGAMTLLDAGTGRLSRGGLEDLLRLPPPLPYGVR